MRLAKELTRTVRRLNQAEQQLRAPKQCEALVAAIDGPGGSNDTNEKTLSLSLISKRLDEAKGRVTEIQGTVLYQRW
jgi:hypothetical protein